MCNKPPIHALVRKDGSIAREPQHIATKLQEVLYCDHRQMAGSSIEATPVNELTLEELNASLKMAPNGASPGPDRIPTRLVREFRRTNEILFLETMKRALLEAILSSWKTSDTSLIPKVRKDRTWWPRATSAKQTFAPDA